MVQGRQSRDDKALVMTRENTACRCHNLNGVSLTTALKAWLQAEHVSSHTGHVARTSS